MQLPSFQVVMNNFVKEAFNDRANRVGRVRNRLHGPGGVGAPPQIAQLARLTGRTFTLYKGIERLRKRLFKNTLKFIVNSFALDQSLRPNDSVSRYVQRTYRGRGGNLFIEKMKFAVTIYLNWDRIVYSFTEGTNRTKDIRIQTLRTLYDVATERKKRKAAVEAEVVQVFDETIYLEAQDKAEECLEDPDVDFDPEQARLLKKRLCDYIDSLVAENN